MATDRHHRQQLLAGWGPEAQDRVRNATVLVVGVGALGCASSELLARAGVGRLVLVDRDIVELTNLQRQQLFAETDIGRPKVSAAADRLRSIDRGIETDPIAAHFDGDLATDLVPSADLIIDGTDNFETRYVQNDAAVAFDRPLIYGGAVATRGTVLPVLPGAGPCLRCLHDEIPPSPETCDTVGVLGPAVAWVGSRQATLALRLLVGGRSSVSPTLEAFDAWSGEHRAMGLAGARDPACLCCVGRSFEHLEGVHATDARPLCGRNSVQIVSGAGRRVSLTGLADRLASLGEFAVSGGLLTGGFNDQAGSDRGIRLTVFSDGRAIIEGTDDRQRARSLYDRYIGA